MSTPNAQAKFLTGNLTKHIVVMSLTSAVGFITLFIVDFVDLLFISMLGVEELAAAVGYAGSILFMTTSVSIGVGIAGGALVARALGEDNAARARELLTHVLVVGIALTLALAALIYINLAPITQLVGASGETQRLTISYLQILIPTMPVMLIGVVASAALRSHGAATSAMNVTLVAGGVNAILDPIFIFALEMGLDGAAWASVAARVSMASVGVWYLVKRYGGFAGLSASAVASDLQKISAIALPAILANVAAPFGSAYVTRMASDFGESAVAGMAIVARVTPIAFAFIFAMSGAIGPIIGQNFGAERHDRVRAAFNASIFLTVAYTVPVVLILYLCRAPLADLFGAEGVSRDLIFLFCGPLSLAWIFNGIIFIGNASYNNLGHPLYSTWVNWGRNTLGTVPFVYYGAQIWGAQGVLVGQMAGGIFVAILSFVLAEWIMRKAEGGLCDGDRKKAFGEHRQEFKAALHRR